MTKHRKPESKRKEAQMGIRFTSAEKARIEAIAMSKGFDSPSAWLRRIVLDALNNG